MPDHFNGIYKKCKLDDAKRIEIYPSNHAEINSPSFIICTGYLFNKLMEWIMKKIACAALLSVLAASPAFAEKDTGIYAGVKLGQADVGGNAIGFGVYGGYNIDPSVTSKMFGHSKFMDKVSFAGEGEYARLGSNSAGASTWKASVIGVALAATYSFNQQFSAIAKAGLARTTNELSCSGCGWGYSDSTISIRYGAAGQFNLNKKIGFRAGYDVFPEGFSQLSAGAVFNF